MSCKGWGVGSWRSGGGREASLTNRSLGCTRRIEDPLAGSDFVYYAVNEVEHGAWTRLGAQ